MLQAASTPWACGGDSSGRGPLTCFPPMASNIFSSCTRSCCVLFMRMQGCGRRAHRESGPHVPRNPPQGLGGLGLGVWGKWGPRESSENGRWQGLAWGGRAEVTPLEGRWEQRREPRRSSRAKSSHTHHGQARPC
jgi:hypothetical protein